MGLTVTTDSKPVTVIRKDGVSQSGNPYTMYSLMYPFKVGDEWKNMFVDAQFKKGTDLPNKCKISINNSFMTGTVFNGNNKLKIFVLDYTVVEGGVEQKPAPTPDDDAFVNIPDSISDELPFN